jgi:predicted O-methyltransferase YrrM
MTREQWTTVDHYLTDLLVPSDPALEAALQASDDAGFPAISVAPNQGKLLHLLVLATGARTVLEIGTLGGYSTIWLARALPPSGRLVTLETDPRHASVARDNIARADLSDVVEIIVGPGAETLPKLAAQHRPPFDLVFIDADKPSTSEYLAWSLELSHVGTLIVVDNVVRQGQVVEQENDDPRVQGMRRFLHRLAGETRLSSTAIQTVGAKGYDGFVLAVVVAEAQQPTGVLVDARPAEALPAAGQTSAQDRPDFAAVHPAADDVFVIA